jgi:hypothetical protein
MKKPIVNSTYIFSEALAELDRLHSTLFKRYCETCSFYKVSSVPYRGFCLCGKGFITCPKLIRKQDPETCLNYLYHNIRIVKISRRKQLEKALFPVRFEYPSLVQSIRWNYYNR